MQHVSKVDSQFLTQLLQIESENLHLKDLRSEVHKLVDDFKEVTWDIVGTFERTAF